MRLGSVLFKDLPHRFRGKYRVVKKVQLSDLHNLRYDYEREEQNMLILRHPYLTVEQSHGHMNEFKEARKAKLWDKWIGHRDEKFTKRVTIAERLNHLTHCDPWD